MKPCTEQLPGRVDQTHDHQDDDHSALQQKLPRWEVASPAHWSRKIARSNRCKPGNHPHRSDASDDGKSRPPAARLFGEQREHDQRCEDRPDGSTALQQTVAHRSATSLGQSANNTYATGPVTRFKHPEQQTQPKQILVSGRHRGCCGRCGPRNQHHRIEPADTHGVGKKPEQDGSHHKPVPERCFHVAVLFVEQTELGLDACRSAGHRLTVEIVDRRSQQQQAANDRHSNGAWAEAFRRSCHGDLESAPANYPVDRSRCHPSHEFPSQLTTR